MFLLKLAPSCKSGELALLKCELVGKGNCECCPPALLECEILGIDAIPLLKYWLGGTCLNIKVHNY